MADRRNVPKSSGGPAFQHGIEYLVNMVGHFPGSTKGRAVQNSIRHIPGTDSSGIVIVEGAYSLSPRFGRYYDLSVFLDIEPEEQIRRIMKRNGEEKAKVFQSRWIPLEEAYFKTYGVEKNADLRFSSLSEEHAQRDS